MAELKYPVIKSRQQYNRYCNTLEELLGKPKQTKEEDEEIELLTTLIEVWDKQHSQAKQLDPIQLLRSFIKEHKLRPLQIMQIMGIHSRGHLYEVLNYQKGLSKEVIRNLATYFKVSQEAFNRAYPLRKLIARTATQTTSIARAMAKKQANKRNTGATKAKQNPSKERGLRKVGAEAV
jgi:HTH-type transcriptional regulator / antitoxin HigA